MLKNHSKSSWHEPLTRTEGASTAFVNTKQCLISATLLSHSHRNSLINSIVDASNVSGGAALHQNVNRRWQPISFLELFHQINALTNLLNILYIHHFCTQNFCTTSQKLLNKVCLDIVQRYNCSFDDFVGKLNVWLSSVIREFPQNKVDVTTSVTYKLLSIKILSRFNIEIILILELFGSISILNFVLKLRRRMIIARIIRSDCNLIKTWKRLAST